MSGKDARKIVIGMPLKNGAKTLRRAVKSVLEQKDVKRNIILFIVNDNSSDNWRDEIKDFIDDNRIVIKNVNIGLIYKVRNFINDYIKNNIKNVDYIGRLDADDYLASDDVLSRLEQIMDKYNPDAIIAGNKLAIGNKIIERINYAEKKLLDFDYLKDKLEKMTRGNPLGELPSCNTFIKPSVVIKYKNVESAEDHWFTVDLLLNKDRYNIYIAENILYSVYSLNGELTNQNRKNSNYIKSRKKLLNYFCNEVKI